MSKLILEKTIISKKNKSIILRSPDISDSEGIIEHAKRALVNQNAMVTTPEEFPSSEDEKKKWIDDKFRDDDSHLIILAIYENKIVGMIEFHPNNRRKKLAHEGYFGISVNENFQGEGIGEALINELLNWAKSHPKIYKVSLSVLGTNPEAYKLYKRMGFIEEGRKINAIQISPGKFIDDILMYKWIDK